jgi:endonuclease YncB( thermonuclease family)
LSLLLRALGAPASAVGAALLTLAVWPPPHPVPDPGAATVVRVVDGDTLVAEVGTGTETVRLIGIDTPESVAPHRAVECYGHEAATRLAALLPPGTPVRLTRDVEARDRYDRLLAYVFRAEDNLFVNRDQVARGFAEAKEYPPNTTRADDLEAAEASARTARAGMWGAC